MVSHPYVTGRGVTIDNFFSGCEKANFLLNKYMTVVGTLRETKPEILALYFSGKQQRDVHSSIFWFYQ